MVPINMDTAFFELEKQLMGTANYTNHNNAQYQPERSAFVIA
jgi:hypothetical protein